MYHVSDHISSEEFVPLSPNAPMWEPSDPLPWQERIISCPSNDLEALQQPILSNVFCQGWVVQNAAFTICKRMLLIIGCYVAHNISMCGMMACKQKQLHNISLSLQRLILNMHKMRVVNRVLTIFTIESCLETVSKGETNWPQRKHPLYTICRCLAACMLMLAYVMLFTVLLIN